VLDDDTRWALMDAAGAAFKSMEGMSRDDRDAAIVQFLRSSDLIEDAGVSTEGHNAWGRFTDGRVILFLDDPLPGSPPPMGVQTSFVEPNVPSSKQVRLLNTLDRRWADIRPTIGSWLSTAGYTLGSAVGTRVTELEQVQGDGVFYWSTHGGVGYLPGGTPLFAFATASKASHEFDLTATYKPFLDAAEICGAWVAADSANTVVEGWHYAITSKFIKAHMHFDPNCVVIVDGCSSAHDEMRDAFYAAGAGAYCGWDALSSNSAGIVVERFLDLLLGQNMVDPENVAQRPFDVSQARLWMVANNKHVDPGNISAHFVIQTNPAQSFGLLCPTIFRIFTHDAPSDPSDYIEIEGEFGDDPGPTNRAVTIGGIAQHVRNWNAHLIEVDVPLAGQGSSGDVTVKTRGHLSNVAQLTRWSVTMTYILKGRGSLQQEIKTTFVLRGDASEYRNAPHTVPFGLAHSITSSKESSATYVMSGVYQTSPTTYIKWKGNGSLKAATSTAQASQVGYLWAGGNIAPTPRTITPYIPYAAASYIIETESRSDVATATLQGFPTLTLTFDPNTYVLKGKSLGPVTVGDGTATLSWPDTPPDAPFNNGGR